MRQRGKPKRQRQENDLDQGNVRMRLSGGTSAVTRILARRTLLAGALRRHERPEALDEYSRLCEVLGLGGTAEYEADKTRAREEEAEWARLRAMSLPEEET